MAFGIGIALSNKQQVLINGLPKEFEKIRTLNLRLNVEKMQKAFGPLFNIIKSKLDFPTDGSIVVLGVRVIAACEGSSITRILAITDISYNSRRISYEPGHMDMEELGLPLNRLTLNPSDPRCQRERGARPTVEIEKALGHLIRAQNLFATNPFDEGIYTEDIPSPNHPSQSSNGISSNGENGNGSNNHGSNGSGSNGNGKN